MREGAKGGVGRHERMKLGRGMQDREERSKGIEIHTSDDFIIIKPTTPFKLEKHEVRRKRNWSTTNYNVSHKTVV